MSILQRTKGNNLDSDKILLSVKEASELTGISERKLRDLMNESNFKVQIGRRTMIHRKNSRNGLTSILAFFKFA